MRGVLFISFLLLLSSCSNTNTNNKQEVKDGLGEAIENAKNSPIVETKLFLDFRFGMTKKEAEKHVTKLVREGKFKEDYRGKYFCYFTTKLGLECKIYASPSYHNGELYKMTYPIESVLVGKEEYAVYDTFKESERFLGFNCYSKKNILDDWVHTCIKDNLVITFKDSKMIYENAPISKLAKEEENQKKQEEYKKSASEF